MFPRTDEPARARSWPIFLATNCSRSRDSSLCTIYSGHYFSLTDQFVKEVRGVDPFRLGLTACYELAAESSGSVAALEVAYPPLRVVGQRTARLTHIATNVK